MLDDGGSLYLLIVVAADGRTPVVMLDYSCSKMDSVVAAEIVVARSFEIRDVAMRLSERVVSVVEASSYVLDIKIHEGVDTGMTTPMALDCSGCVVELGMS